MEEAKTNRESGDILLQGRQMALQRCQQMFSEADSWYIELVKHLALVNSAGLAGVCAIYASDSKSAQILARYPAALCFAVGLLCTVLVMSITSASMQVRAKVVLQRVKCLDRGELPIDQLMEPMPEGLAMLTFTRWLSVAALASFAFGAWPFVRLAS